MSTFDLQGFSYVGWTGPSGFASLDSKITFNRMAQDGANAVAVATFSASVTGATSSVVRNDLATMQEIGQILYDAEARGLKVLLKPHLGVNDGSSSTALTPSDPASLFASYKDMLLGYAKLAQQYHVAAFSIGNEIDSLVTAKYLPYWTDIISAVKAVYTGPITYSAAYPHPGDTAFLSKLDYIGVNPYLALSQSTAPTYQSLVDAWTKPPAVGTWQYSAWGGHSYKDYLHGLSLSYGKPVLITEIGYVSSDRAALDPGNSVPSNIPNQALQSELYRALFDVWSTEKSWMKGVFSWAWAPQADPAHQDAGWATSYDIRDKLAETTVRDALGGAQLPAVSVGTGDTIVLTVAGDSWNGAPEMVLAANGVIVGKALVTAAYSLGQWQQVTMKLGLHHDGLNHIQVYFSNDTTGTAGDRNLYVGSISVDGVSYSGQQGSNNVGWSLGTTAVLQTNGSVTYDVPYPLAASTETLPSCLFGTPGVWGQEAKVTEGARQYDGANYHAVWAPSPWGSVQAVQSAPTTWTPTNAHSLAFDNFAVTNLDFRSATGVGLDLLVVGAKSGSIATSSGDDTITWVAASNTSKGTNTMTIRPGAGNDTVHVTAVGLSPLADYDKAGNGKAYNPSYAGAGSIADVQLEAGTDQVLVEGKVKLILHNNGAAVTAVGGDAADIFYVGRGSALLTGGAGQDAFVVQVGSGHTVVTDFVSGIDRLKFLGVTKADLVMTTAVENGVSGLRIAYDKAGDSIFLEHATKIASTDYAFG